MNLYLKAKEYKVCSLPGAILEERVILIACSYLYENTERNNLSPTSRIRKHEKKKCEPDADNSKVLLERVAEKKGEEI